MILVYFFVKIATLLQPPWKKLPPSFPATPLSKLRSRRGGRLCTLCFLKRTRRKALDYQGWLSQKKIRKPPTGISKTSSYSVKSLRKFPICDRVSLSLLVGDQRSDFKNLFNRKTLIIIIIIMVITRITTTIWRCQYFLQHFHVPNIH